MITKNELYGDYYINITKEDADSTALVLKDQYLNVNTAWSVVESLQEVPIIISTEKVTDEEISELIKLRFPANQIIDPETGEAVE